MKADDYLTLATIAGEVWGTQARATMNQPPVQPTNTTPEPVQPDRVLGPEKYFEVFDRLKDDFKKEVPDGGDETETPDGEDT